MVTGQGHQAALLTAVLARHAAAAMCVGTGNVLAVRNCCYVAVRSAARGTSAPSGRRDAVYIVAAARPQRIVPAPLGPRH